MLIIRDNPFSKWVRRKRYLESLLTEDMDTKMMFKLKEEIRVVKGYLSILRKG